MNSLDKSGQMQVSQGLAVRDSYKEHAANMSSYNRKRPQTGGNAQQLNISTSGKPAQVSGNFMNEQLMMQQNPEHIKAMKKMQ